ADFLTGREYEDRKERALAFLKDGNYRDEVLSFLPAYADEMTWCAIWNAVKREQMAAHPKVATASEEFLKLCGDRFTEVITKTQVYDSVLARSGNMRSKSLYMNMATAFMGEPTTSINMVEDAIYKLVHSDKAEKKTVAKQSAKQIGSVIVSAVLNAVLVALPYAMRDDDEDETFAEKYVSHLVTEVTDGLNPLTYLPLVKDMWSALQGYDIERADMSLASDLLNAMTNLLVLQFQDTDDMSESELDEYHKKLSEQRWGVAEYGFAFLGIPVKNVRRDFKSVFNTAKTLVKDFNERDTTALSMQDAVWEEWSNSIPVLGLMPDQQTSDKLFNATMAGDTAYLKRLNSSYETESSRNAALRKGLRENDPRIYEAAVLFVEAEQTGDFTEFDELKNQIIGEKKFSQNNIIAAISSEINQLTPDDTDGETTEKLKSAYSMENYVDALAKGKTGSAGIIKGEIIDTYVANGDTQEEAEQSFQSKTVTAVKEAYLEGDITSDKVYTILTDYAGLDEEKAEKYLKAYTWMKKNPGYNFTVTQALSYTAPIEKAGGISIEDSGIAPDTFLEYQSAASACTGVDKNGDGRADDGTKKAEILAVIDALPISDRQKDVLYYLNEWSRSTIKDAPWH
ncbi:MAG: hypothetical protein J6J04_04720, partial [Oscillospiraceae bacterium]|nr:hypothetical protein [Oscillospiraceae bacterium]